MSMQKCFCSLSGKYSKLIPYTFRNINHCKTYALLTAERKTFQILRSPLFVNTCASTGTHLSALNNEDKSKDNPFHKLHSLKFEDLSFDKPVPPDVLIKALYSCKTVSEQMEMLSSTLGLCPDDIRNRIKFSRTLESYFKPFFNNFKIQIFGSTVNGLGFKGCDLDFSFETVEGKVDTLDKEEVETSDKEKAFRIISKELEDPNIPLVSEVISGKVTPQEVCQLPSKEKLLFIHSVLLEFYKESEEPSIFILAHVPLVRFHHDKFGLKCDLTFKNKVAFANTKLLYLFHKLDKRVAPLLMTIRYWAKYHEIIGKGLMFNSYTISLMTIFFLQTRNPPILPSAESVLALYDSLGTDEMNDKSFLSILEKIPPSKNEQTLGELLREFFFYYSFFDFTQVICPITATAVPKEEFLPLWKKANFKNNTICIQDPMCLPHNVAELVKYDYCVKLVREMVVACNIFLKEDVFKPSSSPWGLISLLNTPQNCLYKSIFSSKAVSFSVPLLSKPINANIAASERISASADTLLKILDAFLFEYQHLKTSEYLNLLQNQDELVLKNKKEAEAVASKKWLSHQIRQSLKNKQTETKDVDAPSSNISEVGETVFEQFQKFHSENQLIFCIKCTTTENVWDCRYLVKLDTARGSLNILEKEKSISSLTAEWNRKKKVTEPYSFLLDCFVSKDNPTNLILNFRPYKKLYFKVIMSTFLKEHIIKIMRNISDEN